MSRPVSAPKGETHAARPISFLLVLATIGCDLRFTRSDRIAWLATLSFRFIVETESSPCSVVNMLPMVLLRSEPSRPNNNVSTSALW